MKSFIKTTWMQICNMIWVTPQAETSVSLREKAIAVAGRVSVNNDGKCSTVSCPVCLKVLQDKRDSDLKMMLAVHMSLWHGDDVKLQWDIMHKKKKKQAIVHLPSFIIGLGMAAGFGAIVARHLAVSRKR